MASHQVPEIPVLQRQEKVQESATPDFGSAFRELGAAQNNLSAIGAQVAQTSSNTRAQLLGYEAGKNPKGDLPPSFTDFDKHFAESYHAQSAATLSVNANQLMNKSEIELSKANRLTPELIAKSNAQVSQGLSKIAEMAPTAIKGKLEANFSSM